MVKSVASNHELRVRFSHPAPSPCVKICRLEGNVCVGCKRTVEEIANWSKMSDDEKHKINARLAQR